MKKVIKNGVIICMLFVFFVGQANNNSSLKNDSFRTILTFKNVKEGQRVFIKDSNGLILFKETIKQKGTYIKGFDLTELPDGKYFFEIDKDVEIRTIPFRVKSNTVDFLKEKEEVIFKPIVRIKDKMVYISRLSLEGKPLSFKIYFEDNAEEILKQSFSDIALIGEIYDFSKTRSGTYTIVINTEGRTFTKNITLY